MTIAEEELGVDDRLSARHCSQGGGDNWTDLITNITSVEPMRFEADFEAWLGFGTAPPDILAIFLHEATHHACFSGPVGVALTALALRIRRAVTLWALSEGDEEERLEVELLGDLVAFHTAIAFMRPLAEGLAAFAEFDAMPRQNSKSISKVMTWASILFTEPGFYVADDGKIAPEIALMVGLAKAVGSFRRSPQALARKSGLLLRPFSPAKDGYLAGYLAVKSCWVAVGRNSMFAVNESDLFLLYLIVFFYSDYRLASLLIDRDPDPRVAATRIYARLGERLDALMKVTDADLRAFDQAMNDRRAEDLDWTLPVGTGISELEFGKGKADIQTLISDLLVPMSAGGQSLDWFPGHVTDILGRRRYFSLGCVSGTVSVADSRTASLEADGRTIFSSEALPQVVSGQADGAVEIVFALAGGDGVTRATVLSRGDEIVAIELVGPPRDEAQARREIEEMFRVREELAALERRVAKGIGLVVEETWIKYDFAHIRAQFALRIDALYTDIALRFAHSEEAASSCAALMGEHGFEPILRNSSLVKGAALIGLEASIIPLTAAVGEGFVRAGLSLEETLAGLRKVYLEHGFPLEPQISEPFIFSTI